MSAEPCRRFQSLQCSLCYVPAKLVSERKSLRGRGLDNYYYWRKQYLEISFTAFL